jgi:hypothetical protein
MVAATSRLHKSDREKRLSLFATKNEEKRKSLFNWVPTVKIHFGSGIYFMNQHLFLLLVEKKERYS